MMDDYMKEAEQLLDEYIRVGRYWMVQNTGDAEMTARAALLAHIQRGAVPEGERAAFESWIENEAGAGAARRWLNTEAYESVRVQDYRTGWIACLEWLAAAPAPDHFRDAAKMVTAQPRVETFDVGFLESLGAEVPAPAEVALQRGMARDNDALDEARAERACGMGVGCGTSGACYAAASGQPELCQREQITAPASAEAPMPEPVAYGIGNTAITGHTNRLMMVRIDIPGGDQYAGAFWLPLVLADEAHTYGIACRAAGEAAGYARAANWLRASAEKHAAENGYHEPDTGSFVFKNCAAEEWNNSVLELADEMEVALRGEVKP